MKSVLVLLVLWMMGGFAIFQRGGFADGNCATAANIGLTIVAGPLNYAVPETLVERCSQPA
jgi:hypothetical protein